MKKILVIEDEPEVRRNLTINRIFFYDLTREPLQYLIRSHFAFHL